MLFSYYYISLSSTLVGDYHKFKIKILNKTHKTIKDNDNSLIKKEGQAKNNYCKWIFGEYTFSASYFLTQSLSYARKCEQPLVKGEW